MQNPNGAIIPIRPASNFDRVPPHNIEAEIGALGGMILEPWHIDTVQAFLNPEDFYREQHQAVCKRIFGLRSEGQPINGTTVDEAMRTNPEGLHGAKPLELLRAICDGVGNAAETVYCAKIVHEKALQRMLSDVCHETDAEVYSNQFTASQMIENAERKIFAISDKENVGTTRPIREIVPEVIDSLDRRMAGEVTGLGTGIIDLDDMTGGFRPGNLIYLAGRTSMGKTSLAMNIVEYVAIDCGRPVLVVSLEMSEGELVERMACSMSGVNGHKIRTGQVNAAEVDRFKAAARRAQKAPLFIDDTPTRTAAQIAANARRHKARENIQLLVIDYVQLVGSDNPKHSFRERISSISQRFKAISRELEIPVLALAQLNRSVENREGNRPRKSDLKESGSLEEDAHIVVLIHRPDYYDPNDKPGSAVAIVDKNRNGPTGDVNLVFDRGVMKFRSFVPFEVVAPIDDPAF